MLASRSEPAPPAAGCGCASLEAPAHWRAIDVIADLHLQAAEPQTFEAFRRYLQSPQQADALVILGDLFEFWVGDDALAQPGPDEALRAELPEQAFWRQCAELLRQHAERRPVYFMVGNRDFLLQQRAAQAMGMQLLADPCVLRFGPEPWLLSHGDALCLDDQPYQQFRAEVRSSAWQQAFLAQALSTRIAQARGLRKQSEAQRAAPQRPETFIDLDTPATRACLVSHGCHRMLHGHTHRPAKHALGEGLSRLVLSDWDAGAQLPRAEVLRLRRDGWDRLPQPLD